MEFRAPRLRDAVDGPDAAVLGEVRSVGGVPVLRVGHGRPRNQRAFDLGVHERDDLVAAAHAEAAGRVGEVVLEIDHHERNERVVASRGIVGRPGTVVRRPPPA